ncbi:hypothetical protein ACFY0A_39840 [Streptomyces sp. NPDC001698]|uniref:hypothetical protein n=1 Tax=Streptomyces sp. NPDC001698 TaxID=3364601 RepID=UPI0036B80B31
MPPRQQPYVGDALAVPYRSTACWIGTQRGDIVQLGGHACRVRDLFQLPQGAKRLLVESGELLTIHTRTRLVAVRMLRGR